MHECERIVAVSNCEYADLVSAAKECKMLRNLLRKKLESYGGISHKELEDICTMLGMIEEKEI